MGSRYPSIKQLDYCSHPVRISKQGVTYYVACGRCDGCLLHSSNLWSQRLSQEIEDSGFSIFCTPTYSNHYLPKLKVSFENDDEGKPTYQYFPIWTNMRFVPRIDVDGMVYDGYDIRRKDVIYIEDPDYFPVPITNFVPDSPFVSSEFVPYPSKSDVVLWLKNVRKSLNNHFKDAKPTFRYYIISELGGEKYRPHVHCIFFVDNQEWADFLKDYALYACWQMCDQSLFDKHTKYCNAKTSGYLTEYVTLPADLPRIYQHEATKNFRLVSKSPAIGFRGFEKEKVQENVAGGIVTYDRTIHRLGQSYVLRYPSGYMSSLFPKCRGFSSMSFDRLLSVYGYLYYSVYKGGSSYTDLYNRLSSLDSLTFNAQRACLRYCESKGYDCVFHFVYMVDMYYYKVAMSQLADWYTWMQSVDDLFVVLASYRNILDYLSYHHDPKYFMLDDEFFVSQLPLYARSLSFDDLILRIKLSYSKISSIEYVYECSDILQESSKMKDYNELIGAMPHIY